MGLTAEQRETSATLLWLLKGHAAQRVIAAWHVGWQPAREASGSDWLAPFDAELLQDHYGVVRYVAGRSLRALPGFSDLAFDFLAPGEALTNLTRQVQSRWRQLNPHPSRTGGEVMLRANGEIDREAVDWLLRNRDDRSMTISE